MREIKFRIWSESNEEMNKHEDIRILPEEKNLSEVFEDDSVIWMQYTGLKDKNGKEIYEGDIIELHQTINGVSKFTVEWDQKRLGWNLRYAANMIKPRLYEYDVKDVFTIEELEIIGTIYENPELIK